jgi:hypothetical protein
LFVETMQLVLGELRAPSTESQIMKLVVGMRLDFSQFVMKPALISSKRAT